MEAKKPRRSAGPGALTALALHLAKQFAAETSTAAGNLILSPLSIYSALALVAAGARGSTLDELLALLGAASRDDLAEFARGVAERALADGSHSGGPRVAFASGVWYDKARALKPAYRDAAVSSYKAETRAADFHNEADIATVEINKWVAAATNNLISSVVSPGSLRWDTGVIIVNAVYFKGMWTHPFRKESTKVEKFYLLDGTAIDAPLMRSGRRQFIAVHDGFKVLKLPYRVSSNTKKGDLGVPLYSMCVFLPDEHDGLWSLVDEIASGPDFLRDHLPSKSVEVGKLRLPKFNMSFCAPLTGILREMGLKDTFDPNEANISDMAEDDGSGLPLVPRDVFHKAVIEVNEEGTEAAAVTFCSIQIGASPPWARRETVDFVADHPFAFFVIEEVSSAVVFAGYVLDPSK